MELSQEIDDYIKESIDYSLGLPVSTHTLELKLQASEEAQRRLRDQCLHLQSRLEEKDQIIERARAESSMNAQALKKFVEENQKLAVQCSNFLGQCKKLEKECALYYHDREALMDFGNEADERAKEAEIRILELEEEVRRLSEELQCEMQSVDTTLEDRSTEQLLLDSFLAPLVSKDEVALTAHSFLEANSSIEVCQRMLKMGNSLRPTTQKVIALVAEFKSLQKDKEHLRINLQRAEDEVKVLFEENKILDEVNKRLVWQYHKEKHTPVSDGKHTSSTSAKSNKRKSSPKMCSPIERKIEFSDVDSLRQPLSPLQHNSLKSTMHKK